MADEGAKIWGQKPPQTANEQHSAVEEQGIYQAFPCRLDQATKQVPSTARPGSYLLDMFYMYLALLVDSEPVVSLKLGSHKDMD